MQGKRRLKPRNIRKMLYEKYEGKCPACGKQLSLNNPKAKNYMTIDHKYPKSMGGRSNFSNLQAMCFECNQKKSNFTSHGHDYWMRKSY